MAGEGLWLQQSFLMFFELQKTCKSRVNLEMLDEKKVNIVVQRV
jgi:hypothetical protein